MLASPARSAHLLALLLLSSSTVGAQDVPLPPSPVPVVPVPPPGAGLGRPIPISPAIPPTPLSYNPPPPAMTVVPVGPALDPILDGWGAGGPDCNYPGWFFDAELALVYPSFRFRIENTAPLPNTGQTLQIPTADLDNALSPTFEAGYRLPGNAGLIAASCAFLYSEGKGQGTLSGASADVRTKLGVNWLDLDYGVTPYEVAPRYNLSWRLGARILDVDVDSRASNSLHTQQFSNNFFGAGPHGRVEVERRIVPLPGLSLYGRLDGSVLVGRIRQNFAVNTGPAGAVVTDTTSVRYSQTVPTVNAQAGLSYSPPSLPGVKFTSGYLYEQYWSVGRSNDDMVGMPRTKGDLWWHGWFLRGQIDF